MNASHLFAFVATVSLVSACCLTSSASALEALDNDKLIEMIKGDQTLVVILATIKEDPKACKFLSGTKEKIALSKACKEAGWTKDDTEKLQLKVLELAAQGLKDLKNLVNLFLAAVENEDKTQNPQQYEEMMHKLIRSGSNIVPYLRDNITQESERKRGGILEALARIGDKSPDLVKEIVMMLDDTSKPVRAEAAKTVAALSGAETGPMLLNMLNRRDKSNDAVALALGYMGYAPAVEPLVKVLTLSRESDDRLCAAFALGEIRAKSTTARDALLEGILDSKDEKLREVCAKSCALIGEKRAVSHITRSYDRFSGKPKTILTVLASFKSIPAAKYLVNQLSEAEDGEVRTIAKKALEVMTGERFESKEEWLSHIDLLSLRPEWQEQKDPTQLPDAQDSK